MNVYFFKGRPPRGSREQLFLEELEKRGELPVIIIATVSGLITFLLLFIIIATTACFIYKKKRKEKQLKGMQKAPSEGTVLFCLFFCLNSLHTKLTHVSGCPFLTTLSLSSVFFG